MDQLTKGYRVIIVEKEDEDSIYDAIKSQSLTQKIDTMILGGHGTEGSVLFGHKLNNNDIGNEKGNIDITDSEELSKLRYCFVEKPIVIFEACSTGKDNKSIGAVVSDALKATAFAPREPAFIRRYVTDTKGRVKEVVYTKSSNRFLSGHIEKS